MFTPSVFLLICEQIYHTHGDLTTYFYDNISRICYTSLVYILVFSDIPQTFWHPEYSARIAGPKKQKERLP